MIADATSLHLFASASATGCVACDQQTTYRALMLPTWSQCDFCKRDGKRCASCSQRRQKLGTADCAEHYEAAERYAIALVEFGQEFGCESPCLVTSCLCGIEAARVAGKGGIKRWLRQ